LKKSKILFILHRSPPPHGAARVGDFISTSAKLSTTFECEFIKIQSSEKIDDIGVVSLKKLYLAIRLFFELLFALAIFRPDKVYFTASVRGTAFYRDLLLSILWKLYRLFQPADVFYHYHTKGIDSFVSSSKLHLILTRFFLKKVNIVLLSPLLKEDFRKARVYQKVAFLSNGVKDSVSEGSFSENIDRKYDNLSQIQVLYLSQMTKEKGYDEVLNLARHTKNRNIHYQFAGAWQSLEDEEFFYGFVKKYALEESVTYHGFVGGVEKDNLFKASHLLAYPSRNDAFPLTIIESLSYGVPVIATNQGAIQLMLDVKCGIVVDHFADFLSGFERSQLNLINRETAHYCRNRFLREFTLERFENNLIGVFND